MPDIESRLRLIYEDWLPWEQKLEEAKAEAKRRSVEVMEELWTEEDQAAYSRLSKLKTQLLNELREATLKGEYNGEATAVVNKKKVEVDKQAAARWVLKDMLFGFLTELEYMQDLSEARKFIEYMNHQHSSWLTITPEAEKQIEEAKLKRTFEVPDGVVDYKEYQTTNFYEAKLLNPKVEK